MSSGSTLPQAAVSGVVTTANYAPAKAPGSRPRKVGEDDGVEDEEDEPDPDLPGEPAPIGDGLWALMLLAGAFAFVRVFLKKNAR